MIPAVALNKLQASSVLFHFARYTIREENLSDRVGSDLSIKRTERSDSALFSCVATNAFGSDDTNINLIVQGLSEKEKNMLCSSSKFKKEINKIITKKNKQLTTTAI